MPDADAQPTGGPVDHGPRTRAAGSALLVELLEERVLLSKGHDGFGALDDQGGRDGQAASLAKQQVVQVKVADLVADGLGSVIQGLPVQDGQVQAIRTGDTLQIGSSFFQFASGPGYPLVPVNGPSVPGDVGVPRGPMPVLLPMTEPAPAMVSTPTVASPVAAAPAPTPVVASPTLLVAVATESILPVATHAPAATAAPVATSSSPSSEPVSEPAAPILTPVLTAQATAAAQGTVAAAAAAVAASIPAAVPSAASAVAATPIAPIVTGSPSEASAAVSTGSTSSPAPAPVSVSASVTTAASTEPATSTADGNGNGSEDAPAAATSAAQAAAALVVIAANLPSSAAPTVQAAPATAAPNATSGASLPVGGGLPPAPASLGDRSNRDQGASDEQAGTPTAAAPSAVAEVPIVALSPAGAGGSTIEMDENGSVRLADSGEEFADTTEVEAAGAWDAEGEDGEASESAPLLEGLAPFIAGSVACLAWGNYLHAANPAERRDDRESEDGPDVRAS